MIDDHGHGHDRSGIDCGEGHQCAFYWQGKELFRGMVMSTTYNNRKIMVTAYDSGIYLANNKDTFYYSNKTATQIFKDCVSRLKMDIGEVADIKYVIPELPKPKTSYYDVICDALSLTYKATGNRYYPISMKGKISLLKRKDQMLKWVIETGQNLIDFSYSKSIDKTRTRIKLFSENGSVIAEKVNQSLEKTIGAFQEVDSPKDTLNKAQLDTLADNLLKEKGMPNQSFNVSALGIPGVFSGKCVYIKVKELDISRTFFIDGDSHKFKSNLHTMNLTLNYSKNLASIE